MKLIQKADLNIVLPMPAQQITIALDRVFSQEESILIKLGFRSHEMEDKWFIYCEKNVLYFHRSWTGHCIYEVFFIEIGDTLRMIRVNLNRNPQQYKETRNERDVEIISRLIDDLLLSR